MLKPSAFMLAALALLTGCATTADVDKARASWNGATYDEVVAAWGQPASQTTLQDGLQGYTWISQSGGYGPSVGAYGGSGGGGDGNVATTIAGFIGSRAVALLLTLVLVGVGIAHIVKAVKKGYAKHFQAPPRAMKAIHPIARTGLVARGLVFLILAFLFFYRGLSAGEEGGGTPGIKAALDFLNELPAGFLLIGAMGLGLICFALYSFLEAIWRRINVEDADAGR